MVCGMLVCVSLSINVCMFTVSNALLMSNATAIAPVGGMDWLKPVVCISGVFGLEPVLCCDVWYVLYYIWKNHLLKCFGDVGLYDVPMLMSLLCLGTGMMLANFHTCGILLPLSAALYVDVWPCRVVDCCLDLISCDVYMSCSLSSFLVIFLFVVLVL